MAGGKPTPRASPPLNATKTGISVSSHAHGLVFNPCPLAIRSDNQPFECALSIGPARLGTGNVDIVRTGSRTPGGWTVGAEPVRECSMKMWLKLGAPIGGVKRRSLDEAIPLREVHWAVAQRMANLAGEDTRVAAGLAQFQDLQVVKAVDRLSPWLALACAEGAGFDKAIIEFATPGRRSDAVLYWIRLGQVRVVAVTGRGVSTGADSSGGSAGTEEIRLSYGEIHWEYSNPDPARGPYGGASAGWSVRENRRV